MAHMVRDHARPRNIQINENVACVLLSTVGLNIHITQPSRLRARRNRIVAVLANWSAVHSRSPGKARVSLVVNQTDEVQLMRRLPRAACEYSCKVIQNPRLSMTAIL